MAKLKRWPALLLGAAAVLLLGATALGNPAGATVPSSTPSAVLGSSSAAGAPTTASQRHQISATASTQIAHAAPANATATSRAALAPNIYQPSAVPRPPSPTTTSLLHPGPSPVVGSPTPTPIPVPTATATPTPVPSGTPFFDEEFNGTALDPTKWTVLNRPGDDSNFERECYRPENAVVAGGVLTFTDQKDGYCATTFNRSDLPYSSAMVQTTSFYFTYGTIEFRAKMPAGLGQWPGLWLLGAKCQASNITDPNDPTCLWPTPGYDEIDVFEGKGAEPWLGFFNLHTGDQPNTDNHAYGCTVTLPWVTNDPNFNTTTAFHTYDLIWSPGSLVWKVDGVETCSTTSFVPNTPMFLIMNVALGGFGGTPVDESKFPQTMQVDWVRIYH